MTYLTLVNNVLARLREASVSTVSEKAYSLMIGRFINDAKRQVEDAFNWDMMSTTLTLTTVAGTTNYVATGAGMHPRDLTLNDTTNKSVIKIAPLQWIIDQQQLSTVSPGNPSYYAWNGSNGTDRKIELFPTPVGAATLKANLYVPQAPLSSDNDILLIPSEAVEAGAYARALVERGEDSGLNSSEAFALYKGILADQIAYESALYIENSTWTPT